MGLPREKLPQVRPCGQGTEAGVCVTRPTLWPSCQTFCILELMRAEGGATGPVGVNYRRTEVPGGPSYNRSPDWGQGLHHREAVSTSVCPAVLSPVEKLELPLVRGEGRVSVFSSCTTPGPCLHSHGGAGLGRQGTRQGLQLGARHSSPSSCPVSSASREGYCGSSAPTHRCHGEMCSLGSVLTYTP